MTDEPLPIPPMVVYTHLIPNNSRAYTLWLKKCREKEEEQGEARRLRQAGCSHPMKKWYSLTASDYILCLDCGKQFPVEGE